MLKAFVSDSSSSRGIIGSSELFKRPASRKFEPSIALVNAVLVTVLLSLGLVHAQDFSLRFYGNGVNDIDRVKIRIDDPANSDPGPPVDVGATDFTIEFWMRARSGENGAGAVNCGSNIAWINGNIILDRDRFFQDRKYGLSVAGGVVVFGVSGDGTGDYTICGTSDVLDDQWHHIAVERRRSDGWVWLYVDGNLESQADGPDGEVSYPDDGIPGNFCGGPCTNSDPFLVIGAEKHDVEVEQFPAFSGWLDEVRFSNTIRYLSNFAPLTQPFNPDINTVALYHFDEGTGDAITDSSGAVGGPSSGVRNFGGSPAGPEWSTQTPFNEQIGQWEGPFDWPIAAVHAVLQPTGEVLIFEIVGGGQSAQLWDPITDAFTPIPVASNVHCGGHAALSDGRTIFIGGQTNPCCNTGIPDTNLFDPITQNWGPVADMNFARWYPTATALADGRVLATAGWITLGQVAETPEVYDPQTDTWTALTNLGTPVTTATGNAYIFMFLLPDGSVLKAGPDIATARIDVDAQTYIPVGDSIIDGHSAVMYRPGEIIKSGTYGDLGNPDPVHGRTVVVDMNQTTPAWREVASMEFARSYHNLVVLPDGTVLVIGGEQTTNGQNVAAAVYDAELWDPNTETWSTMASMQRPRLYHSEGLLLPDGRVLALGGNWPPYLEANAEIYSPPYLFKGPRPVITSAPAEIQYGLNFFVEAPDASTIALVSLLRLGAPTHGFDQNQRFVPLTFSETADGLDVQASADSNIAPPGYYMFFIVNANGVPSVAEFVAVNNSPPPTTTTSTTTSSSTTTSTTPSTTTTTTSTTTTSTVLPPTTTTTSTSSTTSSVTPTSTSTTSTTLSVTNPVAAYAFDEGSGTTTADASGNDNGGTRVGASWTTGQFGNALSFDGSGDYVSVPDDDSLDITGELMLEAWIFPTSLGGYRMIIDKTTTGQPTNYFLVLFGDEVNFGFFTNGWREHITSGVDLPVDTWSHVAAVYNDTANIVRIYVNGVEVLSEVENRSLIPNGQELRIGIGSPGEEFIGRIDNVRVTNQALSETEIQDNMNAPVTPPPPTTTTTSTTTTKYYHFDDHHYEHIHNHHDASSPRSFCRSESRAGCEQQWLDGGASQSRLCLHGGCVFSELRQFQRPVGGSGKKYSRQQF